LNIRTTLYVISCRQRQSDDGVCCGVLFRVSASFCGTVTVAMQVFGTNVMVTVAKSFEAPIKCKEHVSFVQ